MLSVFVLNSIKEGGDYCENDNQWVLSFKKYERYIF